METSRSNESGFSKHHDQIIYRLEFVFLHWMLLFSPLEVHPTWTQHDCPQIIPHEPNNRPNIYLERLTGSSSKLTVAHDGPNKTDKWPTKKKKNFVGYLFDLLMGPTYAPHDPSMVPKWSNMGPTYPNNSGKSSYHGQWALAQELQPGSPTRDLLFIENNSLDGFPAHWLLVFQNRLFNLSTVLLLYTVATAQVQHPTSKRAAKNTLEL